MISLEEAEARVLAAVVALDPVEVALADALGCVLADDAIATELIPPFDNTSVDGYALRAADVATLPARLRVLGEVRAGAGATVAVGVGEAIRIMTGAPIPPGADAVVMVEDTAIEGSEVVVNARVAPGESIRPAGDDVRPGDVVLRAGTVLGPAHLGVLAELACLRPRVHRRLSVAVIATGDELVTDGSPLLPGQIRESNTELLMGLVARSNCIGVDYGVIADDEVQLRAALADAAATCDAVLTSGGVSMGDYDFVKVLLGELGTVDWMQIAMRPGKPFALGLIGKGGRGVPVFALPGNPVSSLVSYELLARPALMKMMGFADVHRPVVRAVADARIGRNTTDERVNFVRVVARLAPDGRVHVVPTGAQGSHQLANSAAANGFARIDSGAIEVGGEVDVVLIGVAPGQL